MTKFELLGRIEKAINLINRKDFSVAAVVLEEIRTELYNTTKKDPYEEYYEGFRK